MFSSQLAFYEYLLTHQWRKVRVTRTPAYDVMGAAALFFRLNRADKPRQRYAIFPGLEVKEFAEETATGMMDSLLTPPAIT